MSRLAGNGPPSPRADLSAGDPRLGEGKPFQAGERVLLVDRKGRHYLVRLRAGRSFQSHAGVVGHDTIIGLPEGSEVSAATKDAERRSQAKYLALRPTLADLVVGMPRGAQVIYPKDLGAMLIAADIGPGVRVLESGVGSGALSMALLRAGALVTGYEIRADFAEGARSNVQALFGELPSSYEVQAERDVYEGIEGEFDRVVLDLPEPWRVVGHAEHALVAGGI
ncbi:MAG: tRNA (adenine-N1)-methyltransferase, partial [Acidimicrobiales bacterium]